MNVRKCANSTLCSANTPKAHDWLRALFDIYYAIIDRTNKPGRQSQFAQRMIRSYLNFRLAKPPDKTVNGQFISGELNLGNFW